MSPHPVQKQISVIATNFQPCIQPRPALRHPFSNQVRTQERERRDSSSHFIYCPLLSPLSCPLSFLISWHNFTLPFPTDRRNEGAAQVAGGHTEETLAGWWPPDIRSSLAAGAARTRGCRLLAQPLVDHKARQGPSTILSIISIPIMLGSQFYFSYLILAQILELFC